MSLGHALMILMEHLMDPVTMHYAAFSIEAVGLVMAIIYLPMEIPDRHCEGYSADSFSGRAGLNLSMCTTHIVSGCNL